MSPSPRIAFLLALGFCFTVLPAQPPAGSRVEDKESGRLWTRIASLATAEGDSLVVPNVFTPNGDGKNDFIEIETDGSTNYSFSIFTRIGTRIFFSESPRIFWDGKNSRGEDMPQGIYYYVLEEKGGDDTFEAAGFIYLFR